MQTPYVPERVRLDGTEQQFFVTEVDEERKVVQLMPVSGAGPFLDDVPYFALRRNPDA